MVLSSNPSLLRFLELSLLVIAKSGFRDRSEIPSSDLIDGAATLLLAASLQFVFVTAPSWLLFSSIGGCY